MSKKDERFQHCKHASIQAHKDYTTKKLYHDKRPSLLWKSFVSFSAGLLSKSFKWMN